MCFALAAVSLAACTGRASTGTKGSPRPAPAPPPAPPAVVPAPPLPANAPVPISVSVTSDPLGAEVLGERDRVLGRTPLMFVEPLLPSAASAPLRYRVRFAGGRVVVVTGRAENGTLDLFASQDGRTRASTGATAVGANETQAVPRVAGSLAGSYRCTFAQGGYHYPPFDCRIRDDGGTLRFEKDQGSQRIRATLVPTPDGFRLSGTFYCPWGACTDSISGSFRRDERGRYVGSIHPNGASIRVTVAPSDDGATAARPPDVAARPRRPRPPPIDVIDPW